MLESVELSMVAAMFNQYPWAMSCVIVSVLILLAVVGLSIWRGQKNKNLQPKFGLKSRKEQARFKVVSTIYQPKIFRSK